MAQTEMLPALSIVIVTYNSKHLIDRCLTPLMAASPVPIEIVVVDNLSSDGTADHVAANYPGVRLVRSDVNGGFAAGNNLGFLYCTAPFILLLNPDAFVDSVQQVLALAGHLQSRPDAGAAGPRLVNADGSHQVGDSGWRIGLGSIAAHMFFLQRLVPSVPSLYLTSPALLARDEVDVDWICGACTMVRRDVINRIGGLDERIFMYGEDVEWGTRMRDHGLRVLYLPGMSVTHLQGATQTDGSTAFYSTKWIDSTLAAVQRDASAPTYLAARLIMAVGLLLRSLLYLAIGVLRNRRSSRTRSRHMWNYMRHVLRARSIA